MTQTTSQVIRLTGWGTFEELGSSIKALLFGHLVDKAIEDGVRVYRSDLFHDALWVDKHVTGECDFLWGTREYGTSIGMDDEAMRAALSVLGGKLYRVRLFAEKGEWHVTFSHDEEGS